MKKELKIIRANEDTKCDVEMFISKSICIEDMKIELELELIREGIGSVKKKYLPADITQANLSKLSNYGLNLDMAGWDGKNLVQSIRDESISLEVDYFHKGIGWLNLHKGLVFRGKNLIGSKIESRLEGDKFNLSQKGELKDWVAGVNKYIIGDKYLELLLTVGFTSILTNLMNIDDYIGSLVFNLCCGQPIERDIVIRLLNSIWGEPNHKNGGLINIFNGNESKLIESIEGNSGVSVLIKDISNTNNNLLVKIINTIQSTNINSTVITSSNKSIMDINKNNSTILSRGNISEIDMDIHEILGLRENISKIETLIRKNYGLSGVKLIEHIFSNGIDNVRGEFGRLSVELEKERCSNGIDPDKIPKMSIVLLTAKYIVEALELKIDINQLKDTLIKLEHDNNPSEITLYNKALNDMVDYFNNNRDKFVMKGEDIKSNTVGLYDINDKEKTSKLIIPNKTFEDIITKRGYNCRKTLTAWKNKGLLECDKDRTNKKVNFGVESLRCVVILINGDQEND